MLLDNQTFDFLDKNYKNQVLSQIPNSYFPESVILNISLKFDLIKIFRINRFIATNIISQFPSFERSVKKAIGLFIKQKGLKQPQHGIHLLIRVSNCPLPVQNIKSQQFQLASFQQQEGIMVYLKDLLVVDVSQDQVFLFSAVQNWGQKCNCSEDKQVKQRIFTQSLLKVIQTNSFQQDKLKNITTQQPLQCQKCLKNYQYLGRQNQIYLNCQKITCLLPKRIQKQSIFEGRELIAYGQLGITSQLKVGSIISCCAYLFVRPIVVKISAKQPIGIKSQYSSFLINATLHQPEQNLLTIRSDNTDFFYQIANIGLSQKYCQNLTQTQNILYNYEKLVQSVDRLRFSYLPPSMLTTLKLSLLNSVCNHHTNTNLHLCLITEDLQLALRVMYISGLQIKRWPSEYDSSSIISWLKCCRGGIVIIVNPVKKDFQLMQQYFGRKIKGLQNILITFWVLSQSNPKKQINIDNFGIVLDLTTQKNINICREAIEESIDLKLSAFIAEQFDSCPITIVKQKNIRGRIELIERKPLQVSQAQKQAQQQYCLNLLQNYYLKCRDLKKTSSVTLSYLYKLSRGFANLRSALKGEDWSSRQGKISILDSVLAIFLDEESARNKVSNSNTIFGTEVSKLMLNEQQCEISFWDYVSQEDGELIQQKNYMSKSEMFKKMLVKLNSLLFDQENIIQIYQ